MNLFPNYLRAHRTGGCRGNQATNKQKININYINNETMKEKKKNTELSSNKETNEYQQTNKRAIEL